MADCGRLDGGQPPYVLSVAALAVLVIRPTLRQVSRARARIEMLTQIMGDPARVALLVVGEGEHSPREVGRTLGVTVAGSLPQDRKTAAVLSDGAGSRRGLQARPLIRAAAGVARSLRGAAVPPGQHRHLPGGTRTQEASATP
jgi:hypothetical protein